MFVFFLHGIVFLFLVAFLVAVGFFGACFCMRMLHAKGRLEECFPKPEPPDEAAGPTIDITPQDGDGPKFTTGVDLANGPDKSVIYPMASRFPMPSEWAYRDSGQLVDI